jgi:hypothetical protein
MVYGYFGVFEEIWNEIGKKLKGKEKEWMS